MMPWLLALFLLAVGTVTGFVVASVFMLDGFPNKKERDKK